MTGLALRRAISMAALLDERHLLERQLDPEVAARHHHAVEGLDDLGEVVDRLGLLDLGDDGQPHADLVHHRVDVVEVRGRPHEGQRDHVGAQPERPAQVLLVLLGQGRHGHRDAGQVDALVVGDRAADGHDAADVGVGDLDRPASADLAVVDQQRVAGTARRPAGPCRSCRPRSWSPSTSRVVMVNWRRRPARPGRPENRRGADLGTLQVDQDPDGVTGLVAGLADLAVDLLVVGVLAVGEVQPGDVHARIDELADALGGGDCGAEGADDLGATHGCDPIGRASRERDRGHPADSPSRGMPRGAPRQTTSGRSFGLIGTRQGGLARQVTGRPPLPPNGPRRWPTR